MYMKYMRNLRLVVTGYLVSIRSLLVIVRNKAGQLMTVKCLTSVITIISIKRIVIIAIVCIVCAVLVYVIPSMKNSIQSLPGFNQVSQIDGEELLVFIGLFIVFWFFSSFVTIGQQCRFYITNFTFLPMTLFIMSFAVCLWQTQIIYATLQRDKRIWICLHSATKLHQSVFLELQSDGVIVGCWHLRPTEAPYGGEIRIEPGMINYFFAFLRVIVGRPRLIIDLFLRGEKGAGFKIHPTDESHYQSTLDTAAISLPYKRLEITEDNFPLFVIGEIQKKFGIGLEELIKTMTCGLEFDIWISPPCIDPVKDRPLNSIQLLSEDAFTSQDGIGQLSPNKLSEEGLFIIQLLFHLAKK